jgi:hypothetical protein
LAWLGADPARGMPFGEFGDEVDVLREVVRIKMRYTRSHDTWR